MHSDNQKPGSKDGKVYNVYMQEVDPTNNMPKNPNQVRGVDAEIEPPPAYHERAPPPPHCLAAACSWPDEGTEHQAPSQ